MYTAVRSFNRFTAVETGVGSRVESVYTPSSSGSVGFARCACARVCITKCRERGAGLAGIDFRIGLLLLLLGGEEGGELRGGCLVMRFAVFLSSGEVGMILDRMLDFFLILFFWSCWFILVWFGEMNVRKMRVFENYIPVLRLK